MRTARSAVVPEAAQARWLALLTVVACIVTVGVAIYVEMGALLAMPLVGAALVALIAWLGTSFRHPGESDRVVVLYIAGIVALMVEHAEQWHGRTPERVMQIASGWVAPGFEFNERMLIVIFAIACPALFLLGGFYLVRGLSIGGYMAWLLFVWTLFAGVIQGVVAISRDDGFGVAGGILACVPALCIGALGVRRLTLSARAVSNVPR